MLRAASDYRRSKDVIIHGEHINGKWASEIRNKKKEKEQKAVAKAAVKEAKLAEKKAKLQA